MILITCGNISNRLMWWDNNWIKERQKKVSPSVANMAKWEDFFSCSALKTRGYDIFTQISKTPFCLLRFFFISISCEILFVWNVNAKDFRCVTIRQNRIIFEQQTKQAKWVKGEHDNCRDACEGNSFHTQELCVCGCVMAF